MLPLQFILLLILATIPREMAEGHPETFDMGFGAGSAANQTLGTTLLVFGSLLVSQLFLAGVVWMRARAAVRALEVPSVSATAVTMKTDALFGRARWLSILITVIHLYSSPMPAAVMWHLESTVVLKHIPLLPEMLFILPAVLAWLGIWTGAYFVEVAVHERGLAYRLARETPVHEMPSLGGYVSMQVRHNFFPLVLLLLKAAVGMVGDLFAVRAPWVEPVASTVGFLLILLVFPWLLVRIWSTTPLVGPLRQRLDGVAKLYRLRFRNILLWKTQHLVSNAAILGWIPSTRYFLMTDALLETFNDRQLEAVFAHEVGHGIHRHIAWNLAALFGAMALAAGLTGIAIYYLPASMLHHVDLGAVGQLMTIVLLCVIVVATLPFVASRFEHQADWFACRHMARMLEEGAAAGASLPAGELFSAHQPLPAELQWSLSTAAGAEEGLPGVEGLTLEQYIAGHYPHAAEGGSGKGAAGGSQGAAIPEATPEVRVPEVPVPAVSLPMAAAWPAFMPAAKRTAAAREGAEIFISALDRLVEDSNKARDKRGWMHPSINDRIRLMREMATTPAAVLQFDRLMVRTRMWVVLLLLGGIVATAIAGALPERPGAAGATQPATRGNSLPATHGASTR